MEQNNISKNIIEMQRDIKYLIERFDRFEKDYRELNSTVDNMKESNATLKERLSNMNIFQTILSIVIGAVATYLGTKK